MSAERQSLPDINEIDRILIATALRDAFTVSNLSKSDLDKETFYEQVIWPAVYPEQFNDHDLYTDNVVPIHMGNKVTTTGIDAYRLDIMDALLVLEEKKQIDPDVSLLTRQVLGWASITPLATVTQLPQRDQTTMESTQTMDAVVYYFPR